MFGALIVAHDTLAVDLLSVLQNIVGVTEGIKCVSIDWNDNHERGIEKVQKSLKTLQGYDGVVVFTDMFGGTPTNISLPFLDKNKIEIITGVNLPMLIKFINMQNDHSLDLSGVIQGIKERAQQSIKVPGEIYFQKAEKKK